MPDTTLRPKFWELPLEQLSPSEWESLCDGCGRCCLKKLSDEDSGEVHYTRVVCRFFEQKSSRCGCYNERTKRVPDCLDVRTMDLDGSDWMPDSCAYKLRYQGKRLYDWHPLIAGSREKMAAAGILLEGRVISETHVHPDGFDEHLIRWVKT